MSEVQDGERLSTCSYVLRPLVKDVPLSAEEDADEISITCVELYGIIGIPLIHVLC